MSGPALSNYLTVLAVEVAGEVAAYKRSSTAAHAAYLEAGAKLAEARAVARRGEWTPFLAAAGVEPRTARNMLALAKSELTPEKVTALGGVRAALESLRDADAAAKPETVSAIEAPQPPQSDTVTKIGSAPDSANPAPSSLVTAPDAAERRSLAHETPLAPAEARSVHAGVPHVADSSSTATPATLYQRRRAEGRCIACGEPSGGKARCPRCASRLATRRRGRDPRHVLARAANAGRGVRLSAAEVARLNAELPEPSRDAREAPAHRRRCARTVDWVGERESG